MNPNPPLPPVGPRLRAIRDRRGLSLRALAEKSGLSTNAISLIERGENSPTVSTLHRLAQALDVTIAELFRDEGEQSVVFVERGRGLRAQSREARMESLGSGLYDQRMEPFRMKVAPGGGNLDDPISHAGEEFVHCLEGEIEYRIGDRLYRLGRGDSLLFDSASPHAYRNPGTREAVLLIVFQAAQDRHSLHRLHLE